MQFINNFILLIIYINILFSTVIMATVLVGKLSAKHNNVIDYKIKNWYIITFCT